MARQTFDVFLSHASIDKPVVELLARKLQDSGIKLWLDKWNLIPGTSWQPAIEEALANCLSCAVFFGSRGSGPWQAEEMRAAISRRVSSTNGSFRVIPVLLPGSKHRGRLPEFLRATTWVEFHNSINDDQAFHRLVCGIRGVQPGSEPSEPRDCLDEAIRQSSQTTGPGSRFFTMTAEDLEDNDVRKEEPFQRGKDGIVDVYPTFPTTEFRELLSKAKEVNILQTFIPETGHLRVLYDPLIEAINCGCQIRVLICHHRSRVVDIRQKALAEGLQTNVRKAVRNNVLTFGNIYRELRSERKKALQVRAYTTLPSMCIYQADETFFFGCYFHGMLAIEGLQIRVEGRGTPWGKALCDEFSKLWGHKETTDVKLRAAKNWLKLGSSIQAVAIHRRNNTQ